MKKENNEQLLFDVLSPVDIEEQLRVLWHLVFGDSYEYINAFFASYPCDKVVHTLSLGQNVVSALYALPFTFLANGKERSAAYIYAVATAPEYRGRGYMRLLMKNVEDLLRKQGVSFLFLMPATDSLRGFYACLGYEDCSMRAVEEFRLHACTGLRGALHQVESAGWLFPYWNKWQRACPSVILHSCELLAVNIASCRMQDGGCFAIVRDDEPVAAAFVIKKNDALLLLDVAGCDNLACEHIKYLLCCHYGAETLSSLVTGSGESLCMGRNLSDYVLSLPLDISLMLDK